MKYDFFKPSYEQESVYTGNPLKIRHKCLFHQVIKATGFLMMLIYIVCIGYGDEIIGSGDRVT